MPDYNLIKPALTNVSVAFKSPNYKIEEILPRVPVSKTTAKYYVFDKENLRITETARAGKTVSNEVTYTVSTGTYTMIRHSNHGLIDQEDRDNAAGTALSPDADMTEVLTEKMLARMEYEGERLIFDTVDYATGNKAAITGTAKWDVGTIADPIGQIESASLTILKKIGRRPNTLVLGAEVWKAIKTSNAVRDNIKYTGFGVPTEEIVAKMFDIDKVVRAEGTYNSVVEGQTDSLLFLWGKRAALLYVSPTPALKSPTFGYIFSHPRGRYVTSWYDPDRDATKIEVNDMFQVKKVDNTAGFLFDGVVS